MAVTCCSLRNQLFTERGLNSKNNYYKLSDMFRSSLIYTHIMILLIAFKNITILFKLNHIICDSKILFQSKAKVYNILAILYLKIR